MRTRYCLNEPFAVALAGLRLGGQVASYQYLAGELVAVAPAVEDDRVKHGTNASVPAGSWNEPAPERAGAADGTDERVIQR